MIYFRKIRFKNFLSTGNVFTEIFFDKAPITLVMGANGAGKSTMLDALTFSLFGKSFRNINKPDLVNTINDSSCVVEVEFRIGVKEYKIIRGLKPAVFEVYCDDKLIDQDGASKDYQAYLEKNILKFNYKAFTQIVILGSSSFIPFMQLPAADRRSIIEDLLDIQVFTSMNQIVKTKINNIKQTANELKNNLDNTMAKIEMQKKYVDEAKKNNSDQLENKNKEYQENLLVVDKLNADASLIKKHIDVLLKNINDEQSIQIKLKKLHTFETKIEGNLKKAEKELKFYKENDSCPTCKQNIGDSFKISAEHGANSSIQEFKSGLYKISEQHNKLNIRLGEICAVHKKITEHQSELTRINASVSQIYKYVNKLFNEISNLQTKKVLSEDMIKISHDLLNTLEELQKQRNEVNENRQFFEIASILLKDNGIKSKIIKQYLPVINKLVNKYLVAMDFFVNFEINESFQETIKSRHRDTFSYGNFSEGEKQKIDLALLFAWRSVAKIKNSMSTNLLILDEVFDSSLDSSSVDSVMKILNVLDNSNVFVISHRGDVFLDKFPNILEFKKSQNFSYIVG